jgi:hypothetical protein
VVAAVAVVVEVEVAVAVEAVEAVEVVEVVVGDYFVLRAQIVINVVLLQHIPLPIFF